MARYAKFPQETCRTNPRRFKIFKSSAWSCHSSIIQCHPFIICFWDDIHKVQVLNFASEGFRHKQMLEVFLINSAGRGMKKTWNHGDQALGAAGNTL
jgi:hypothetical protein